MSASTVTLELHDADSIRVLRAALAGQVRVLQVTATYHDETAKVRNAASDASESRRHKRLAAEFQRRTGLCQQLLDQLPPEPSKGK